MDDTDVNIGESIRVRFLDVPEYSELFSTYESYYRNEEL